ncbi:MAG: hypothetical protein PW789_10495 [Edaphobacter sp.]|uniref:hypothetical protein n=1 Tax=Edaphobacter sp. TaxID=1934404 RepID=UPI00238D5000|nr:hypothetical protein [Edaphobacter sp.]MDE1177019.1 hypothetical protein [Edaphobacter sp.]
MFRIATWCAKCLFLYIVVAILAYKLAWIFVLPVWAAGTKAHLTTQSRFVFMLNYFLPIFAASGFLLGLVPFHRLGKGVTEIAPGLAPMVEPDTVPAIYFAWVPVAFAFLIRFFTWHSRNSSVFGGNNTIGRTARFFGSLNVQTGALLDSRWALDRFLFTGPMLFLMAAAIAVLLRRSILGKPKSAERIG